MSISWLLLLLLLLFTPRFMMMIMITMKRHRELFVLMKEWKFVTTFLLVECSKNKRQTILNLTENYLMVYFFKKNCFCWLMLSEEINNYTASSNASYSSHWLMTAIRFFVRLIGHTWLYLRTLKLLCL